MAAIGNVDPVLVDQVRVAFEQKCIELLELACRALKTKKEINSDWNEENISANIFTYIQESQQSIDADIHIESEHSFYNQKILDNKQKARKAPRIDMVFQHNWSGQRITYYVEAKNLVEKDYYRDGRRRPVKSTAIQKRYIETGIDHFLQGYYPKGCLLGYVLNGTINGVVDALNVMLVKMDREEEQLAFLAGRDPWLTFCSNHPAQGIIINHFLFDFQKK